MTFTATRQPAELRPQTHFCVFKVQGTCLVATTVVLFLLNEILKTEANLVVAECTVCYRLVAYHHHHFI